MIERFLLRLVNSFPHFLGVSWCHRQEGLPMTVEEFLEIHPDEDVDLQVPEGRVLLDHGQVQRLLGADR